MTQVYDPIFINLLTFNNIFLQSDENFYHKLYFKKSQKKRNKMRMLKNATSRTGEKGNWEAIWKKPIRHDQKMNEIGD